jgi:hypothetical protein
VTFEIIWCKYLIDKTFNMMTKALLAASLFLILGCSANSEKKEEAKEQTTEIKPADFAIYSCPMKCEGDKTYPEAGKCPVCKMEMQGMAFYGVDSIKHQH